jgi:hypothetical protein
LAFATLVFTAVILVISRVNFREAYPRHLR